MSLSLIKILKESDSFSPNYIHQYNKVLEDTTGQPLYGNQALFDYVTKPSGSYIGYMYYVGDTGNAVRYSTQGGNIVTVDVFYNYSSKPTYSVQMDYDNPEETIEAVSDIIISPSHSFQNEFITEATKVTKKTIKKPNYGGFDINQFVKPIDNKEKSSIYKWIKSTAINFRDEAVLTVLSQKDYVNAFRLYVNWCKSNAVAIKGMKQYGSYGGFYLKLKEAYELSNVSTLMKKSKSLIMQAESEEIQVNNADAQYFEDLEKKYKLTPNQTYESLKIGIKAVVKGINNSLIVSGDAGSGKSHTVEQELEKSGLQKRSLDMMELQELQDAIRTNDIATIKRMQDEQKGSYVAVKGSSSPLGMYLALFLNRNGIVLFDDCDSVFNDPNGVNIIKATTDDKKFREVSYLSKNTMRKDSLVPPQFEFGGRVIFITNLHMNRIEPAIVSRANIVDFDFTYDESMKLINKYLNNIGKDIPGANMKAKQEVFAYLASIGSGFKKMDFRTFQQVLKMKIMGMPNWKKASARMMAEKQKTY